MWFCSKSVFFSKYWTLYVLWKFSCFFLDSSKEILYLIKQKKKKVVVLMIYKMRKSVVDSKYKSECMFTNNKFLMKTATIFYS